MEKKKSDIGIIGAGVMGSALASNIGTKGFVCSIYDKDSVKIKNLSKKGFDLTNVRSFTKLNEFVSSLKKPRKIFLLVPAGKAVDSVISELTPLLSEGDLLIDGGNSYYKDTIRRFNAIRKQKFLFLGTGISGGEEGALKGPCIMPGGSVEAYSMVSEIFEKIAAKSKGLSCVTFVGVDGAGHFVKMVHNGIEYAMMELIAETYNIMKHSEMFTHEEMADIFSEWNNSNLSSFLVEITAPILKKQDPLTGTPLVEMILDRAGQKGTGKWTAIESFELGIPAPVITSSVEARTISSFKSEREKLSKLLPASKLKNDFKKSELLKSIKEALYLSFVISYLEGFTLIEEGSKVYNFGINLKEIARIWQGGCIIRSKILQDFENIFTSQYQSLRTHPFVIKVIKENIDSLRKIVVLGTQNCIFIPSFSNALSYIDGFKSEKLPANLIQAQRDYFGSHTYTRIDNGKTYHTDWKE